MTRKINHGSLLLLGFFIILAMTVNVLANDDEKGKQPKNTGTVSIKTSPNPYPVFVDGVQVGLSGVNEGASFYLTPGEHRIEVLVPESKTPWSKTVTVKKGGKECICLKIVEKTIKTPCPYNIQISGPDKVTEGDLVTFTTINAANPSSSLKYLWKITPNNLPVTKDSGMSSITIDTTGLGNKSITAEVEVTDGVYDEYCRQKISLTTDIGKLPTPIVRQATEFDSLAFRVFDDDKSRLDNFAVELQNNPDQKGYIIIYQGTAKNSPKSDKMAKRTNEYLVKTRGIEQNRLTIVQGGTREATIGDMWLIPPGANLPVPTPR